MGQFACKGASSLLWLMALPPCRYVVSEGRWPEVEWENVWVSEHGHAAAFGTPVIVMTTQLCLPCAGIFVLSRS